MYLLPCLIEFLILFLQHKRAIRLLQQIYFIQLFRLLKKQSFIKIKGIFHEASNLNNYIQNQGKRLYELYMKDKLEFQN
ncbi:hypothetical protein TTHERM_000161099 (macronuclear) [Tetrahymena thermophila SB210]|uniref:Transmembrane protein n=1 Tax=Tetrahymena thermophila (strain SB210) TaxID=312017 RepID=W7XE64_TETTS|nr:hypothetical protein TTHERM_000161099 [Tetrahymena thermophila SB210]EWS75957.1 hypothetical protein TTHERM_000161099 [Tetrahymena thermophila SB210]|eukprot:XP_012651475.1 hypothetical protein TTHERM_000161099 [Tetrahymena thermophila SB210]